jgi:hypothetical protein
MGVVNPEQKGESMRKFLVDNLAGFCVMHGIIACINAAVIFSLALSELIISGNYSEAIAFAIIGPFVSYIFGASWLFWNFMS